jgi:hypothetical protein
LVQQRRRVVDVQADSAREHERDLLGLADQDQAAGASVDDVVDALAKGSPRRDGVERAEKSRVLSRLQLSLLINRRKRHRSIKDDRPAFEIKR